MSLAILDGKKGKNPPPGSNSNGYLTTMPSGGVQIGEFNSGTKAKPVRTSIVFNPGVPKEKRIKTLGVGAEISPIPYITDKDQRYACYISALSGSGKSYLAAQLVEKIRKARKSPKKWCTIFTSSIINIDPVYDALDDCSIVGFDQPEFQKIASNMQDVKNSIIIFDDYENIKDKQLETQAQNFLKDVLERTRKQFCDIIVINHQTMNYNKTKGIIYECTDYFLNLNTNKNSAMKFLDSYMDLPKEDLEFVRDTEGEGRFSWSLFRKSYPAYYIHGNRVKLL